MLAGKTVILGVTGSIAAYKAAALASALRKQHAQVHVLMTRNACNFIHPVTFETLTDHKCLVDTFDRNFQYEVEHVSLAKQADLVMIAPATANVIAKLAHGLADDMLTTTVLACSCPKIIAPAMNTRMYENPVTQDNLNLLRRYGWNVLEPATGLLACKDVGKGKMPEPEALLDEILQEVSCEKDMAGLKVMVTAGATRESVDPVRFLTNHSSGKMGYAVARAASRRGADVTLVSAHAEIAPPSHVELVQTETARQMFEEVSARAGEQDIIIKAAAVADYRPAEVSGDKVNKKDGEMSLRLERTEDTLAWLGEHKPAGQFLCGFSMETKDLLENSRKKLEKKNLDMIAANNLKIEGAGFGVDTNVLTLITAEGERQLPIMSKEKAAHCLLDAIMEERK